MQMSDLIFQENGLALIDNLLNPEDMKAIRLRIGQVPYYSVHEDQWHKVWRLWDGNPHRGSLTYFDPGNVFNWKGALYPTNTPMDVLINALREVSSVLPGIVGREGIDWFGISLCPWIYPVGSALSEHWDSERYTGAFAYYVHERWGRHWGGDLVVSIARPETPLNVEIESWLAEDGDEGNGEIGINVPSRPNRLALIGSSRPHRVTRVDENAGTHVRLSIAGFFLPRPQ